MLSSEIGYYRVSGKCQKRKGKRKNGGNGTVGSFRQVHMERFGKKLAKLTDSYFTRKITSEL